MRIRWKSEYQDLGELFYLTNDILNFDWSVFHQGYPIRNKNAGSTSHHKRFFVGWFIRAIKKKQRKEAGLNW